MERRELVPSPGTSAVPSSSLSERTGKTLLCPKSLYQQSVPFLPRSRRPASSPVQSVSGSGGEGGGGDGAVGANAVAADGPASSSEVHPLAWTFGSAFLCA